MLRRWLTTLKRVGRGQSNSRRAFSFLSLSPLSHLTPAFIPFPPISPMSCARTAHSRCVCVCIFFPLLLSPPRIFFLKPELDVCRSSHVVSPLHGPDRSRHVLFIAQHRGKTRARSTAAGSGSERELRRGEENKKRVVSLFTQTRGVRV